jgi:hypothetical protein
LLEERVAPTVATSTFSLKHPGTTDSIVTTATNTGGNNPPGHQDAVEVRNKFAK